MTESEDELKPLLALRYQNISKAILCANWRNPNFSIRSNPWGYHYISPIASILLF